MRTLRWRIVALAVAPLALVAGPAGRAQTRRSMTLVDLIGLSRLVDPQLSPDGTRLLYQLNQTDWSADRRTPHIWRQDIGGRAFQLTFGDSGENSPRWSSDGKTILFVRDGQICLLPADGGESRPLTRHATGVASPAWSPDGAAIYFIASDPKTSDERDRDRLKDDAYAFEENAKQRHVWTVIVSTGAEQRITESESSVRSYRLSRDGRRLALHRAPTPLVADASRSEVWVMDADGRNARVLTHNAVEETEAELSPDNSQVLFLAGANPQLEPYYTSSIFVMPSGGGTPRLVAPDFAYDVLHASWAPDGRSIFAAVNMGVHCEIFQIGLDGRAKQLTDGRHSIPNAPGTWSLVPAAERMVFQLDEPARIGDAWTLPTSGGTPARVTGVYDAIERDFRLPREDKIEWKSADGTTIEGLLLYPLDYQPGKRYPLVVQLHGGPDDSDRFSFGTPWIDFVQVWTAKGYAVFKPNYRGSTGYGNAFLRDLVGGYFRSQHLDVLAGVDFLIAQGIADPDHLAAMGWSAGGHLTNKLITFTDRFKAASSGAGAANWTSLYAQSDQRADRAILFGGTPWQKNAPIDLYWNNSPLKDVANVKTPTLFIVGDDDPRVPKEQSIEMYRALTSNGVPTKLWIAPREGHSWIGLRHQLSKANVEIEWFEKYVTGRAYIPEKAP